MTDWLVKRFVKDSEDIKRPSVRTSYGKLAGWVGIVCNVLLALAKLAVGVFSGSLAVTADAINNLSDAASSTVTLVGFKLAERPADDEHPFGHARYEYIAGLAVAIMVFVIGLELFRSSIEKIVDPTPVNFSAITFVVLLLSILLKLWMAVFNRKLGKRIESPTLEATFADSRNDALATAAVLVAALVAYGSGINIDGWMGLAVAVFILVNGVGLVKDTLNPLLGEAPDPKLVSYVEEKINSYEGVLGTHDLIVHDYGPGRQFASAHVEMSSKLDPLIAHDIIDNIERDFKEQDHLQLIIHYDPIITGSAAVDTAHAHIDEVLKKIDARLSFHDLRVVDGPTHTNYIFDVVVPPDFEMSEKELLTSIEQGVQHGKKQIDVVVTFDQSYASIPR